MEQFDFTIKMTRRRKARFANLILGIQAKIPFKVSSRGWAYLLEQEGMINKGQFDKVQNAINDCRKIGLLPVDFVAEDSSRMFNGVENESDGTISGTLKWLLNTVLKGHQYFNPDWWEGEKYYIQMVVEKIDLVTLFRPVCRKYKIPIANAKGWSSISQRAEYAKRFKEAESKGLICVLLYCGDHDPDGLRISETMRSNIADVSQVTWKDGSHGYDPTDLIIERFGLNYDFIIENDFTWIDNLITSTDKNLASPFHRNYNMPYVQDYLETVGERKCEANVLVTLPKVAEELVEQAITKYLGNDAPKRFEKKRLKVEQEYNTLLKQHKLDVSIPKITKKLY